MSNFDVNRLCYVWLVFGWCCALVQAKEYKYFTSREGRQICRADGVMPLQELLKKLYCTDEKVGKKCENDKFCKRNERCLCHNECEEYRCAKYKVPVAVRANNKIENCSLNCQNGGTCVKHTNNTETCKCTSQEMGKYCDRLRDFCDVNPCKNNGTCDEKNRKCNCTSGFIGRTCQVRCSSCPKHTKCQEINGTVQCGCTLEGREGQNCTDIDECRKYPTICTNGYCNNTIGGYNCVCKKGWEGHRCDVQITYCDNVTCLNGGSCVEKNTSFHCMCPAGVYGRLCNETQRTCKNFICNNGGACVDTDKPVYCQCLPAFTGPTCSIPCSAQCFNGGTCINNGNSVCKCAAGFTGTKCETEINECNSNPCVNGTCLDSTNNYTCLCYDGFEGTNCDRRTEVKGKCPHADCQLKDVTGICDQKCNIPECKFDNWQCTLGVPSPWKKCDHAKHCWSVFDNGHCDNRCNTRDCVFDGGDCTPHKNCTFEQQCKKQFNNSLCDESCNTVECGFDADDCHDATNDVPGKLIFILLSTRKQFEGKKVDFVRRLSSTLNSHVTIDEVKEYLINTTRRQRRSTSQSGLNVTMSLKNSKSCVPNCFHSAESAAKYLAAKASKGRLELPVPVKSIKATKGKGTDKASGPWGPLWIVIACTALPVLLIFGVVGKKVTSTLWAPEGHARHVSSGMREPGVGQEGDEMTALKRDSGDSESITCSSGESPTSVRDAKRFKPDMVGVIMGGNEWLSPIRDQRMDSSDGWSIPSPVTYEVRDPTISATTLHKVVQNNKTEVATQLISMGADINAKDNEGCSPLHTSIFYVSHQCFQLLIRNRQCHIDLQSNDGTTPLMLACAHSSYFMVDDLISTGAKVNLTDKQGNTALHACGRVDNCKSVLSLLRNGAKVDAQNIKGETPLFFAARAGSYSSAVVLIQNFANRNIADNMDVTPFNAAQLNGHKDIMDLLSGCNTPASPMASPPPVSPYSEIRPKIVGSMMQPVHFEQTTTKTTGKKRKKPRKNAKNQNISVHYQRQERMFSVQDCIDNFTIQPITLNNVDMNFVLNHRFPTPPSNTMYSPDFDLTNSSLLLTPSPESLGTTSPDSGASFC